MNKERFWVKLYGRIQSTDNLNTVFTDENVGPGNGRHRYAVVFDSDVTYRCDPFEGTEIQELPFLEIQFQEGGRNTEGSIPGVLESDLLEIVRNRLQCFQRGEFACRENACALTHIEEALMWMNKRKEDRKNRGVLGKHEK